MRLLLVSAGVLIVGWLAFVAWLAVAHRKDVPVRDAARLVPDALRLIRRLAADRTISRSARLPVWLLIAYLAFPIDLVPDFIPVIGYVDDVILISVVVRRLVRRAGTDKIAEHWPGTADGLAVFRTLLRLPDSNWRVAE
jgi:uncharacterized membrane protein YkvA (DUF1232 family)